MKLREYQANIANQAANHLRVHHLAYLAMEVRTGKTFTALEAADLYLAKNVLFITKKKAIASIEEDYKALGPAYKLTVTNYESVHKITGKFDLVIIDEAHCLGSYPKPSIRAKAIKVLCDGLPIIYLSGTPSPESYSQLYHQLWVSSYSPWKKYANFYKWANVFVDKTTKRINGFTINDFSNAKIGRIKPVIELFMSSYTQLQAGFKQELREEILSVSMNPIIAQTINSLNKDKIALINGVEVLGDTPAKLLSKLHQLSSGTVIDEAGGYHILDDSKAIAIRDKFKDQKFAIFYVFKTELEMLKQTFPNWTDNPETFQSSTDKVFLGQFRSAREGVRLDTADMLIFFNMEFSYLSWEQARNRLQSKDRVKEAVLYVVQSDCGVERYVYDAVMGKTDFTLSYYGRARK